MEEYIKKLRGLPEEKKKLILWGSTILIGILLMVWWIPRVGNQIQDLQESDFREEFAIPELEKRLQDIPDITFPVIDIQEETASSVEYIEDKEPEL